METIEAYLQRKYDELKLLDDCLDTSLAPAAPRSIDDVIELKFKLTAVLRAQHDLSDWAATETARATKRKDPSIVVVDEVIGQWIALAGAQPFNWKTALAAFALFRLFDIWKPPPVRQLEALPEGLGINADDVMAGVYAALVLLLAGWFNR